MMKLEEVVGCTTEVLVEVGVKLVAEEVSSVDVLLMLVELGGCTIDVVDEDEKAVVVTIVGVRLVEDVVITVVDIEMEACTGQLLLAE